MGGLIDFPWLTWMANKTHPIIRMLVSNTDTMISLSNDTFRMTNWTACSNSSKSPSITSVSSVSTRVIEKLCGTIIIITSILKISLGQSISSPVQLLLSQDVVHVSARRSDSPESTTAGQRHQLVRWPGILQVSPICMIEHVPRLFPVRQTTSVFEQGYWASRYRYSL